MIGNTMQSPGIRVLLVAKCPPRSSVRHNPHDSPQAGWAVQPAVPTSQFFQDPKAQVSENKRSKILLLLHIYSWLLKTPVWTMRFHLHMVFSPINTYYSTMWYEVGWVHGCGTMDACGPMDYSLPDFSVHGILQARLLEWVAISSSREFFLTQGLSLCLLQLLCCG